MNSILVSMLLIQETTSLLFKVRRMALPHVLRAATTLVSASLAVSVIASIASLAFSRMLVRLLVRMLSSALLKISMRICLNLHLIVKVQDLLMVRLARCTWWR